MTANMLQAATANRLDLDHALSLGGCFQFSSLQDCIVEQSLDQKLAIIWQSSSADHSCLVELDSVV